MSPEIPKRPEQSQKPTLIENLKIETQILLGKNKRILQILEDTNRNDEQKTFLLESENFPISIAKKPDGSRYILVPGKENAEITLQVYTMALEMRIKDLDVVLRRLDTERDTKELHLIAKKLEGYNRQDVSLNAKKQRKNIELSIDSERREMERVRLFDAVYSQGKDGLVDVLVHAKEVYGALGEKIINQPKDQRDANLQVLLANMEPYVALTDETFLNKAAENLSERARKLLTASKFHDGLRGKIQKLLTNGVHSTDLVTGDDDSLVSFGLQKFKKMGYKLLEPTTYTPERIKEVEDEIKKELKTLSKSIDGNVIEELLDAIETMLASPNDTLKGEDKKQFMAKYNKFVAESFKLQMAIVQSRTKLLNDAFEKSRGEKSSDFPPDTEWDSKFLHANGQDMIRVLKRWAPFGIGIPENVPLKDAKKRLAQFEKNMSPAEKAEKRFSYFNPKTQKREKLSWNDINGDKELRLEYARRFGFLDVNSVKIESGWETLNKEYPLMSCAAQGTIFAVLGKGAEKIVPRLLRLGAKLPGHIPVAGRVIRGGAWITKRALQKVLPKGASMALGALPARAAAGAGKLTAIAWKVWLAYEITEGLKGMTISSHDKKFNALLLKEAANPGSVDESTLVQMRKDILYYEIQKENGLFRSVTDDKQARADFETEFGWGLNYLHLRPWSENLDKAGLLEKALRRANSRLRVLGLRPYIIRRSAEAPKDVSTEKIDYRSTPAKLCKTYERILIDTKHLTKWAQLSFRVHSEKKITISRYENDLSRSISRGSGNTWSVEGVSGSYTFQQAFMIANFVNFVQEIMNRNNHSPGSNKPFELDGGAIDFDKNWNMNDLRILKSGGSWAQYYEKAGLTKQKLVDALNEAIKF